MRYLHTIFVILFFVLSIFFSLGINQTFANITQVNVESSAEKVRKLQEVFKGLWLYNWEIDWKYSSIKESIVKYQVEAWVISSADAVDAGVFWNRTIRSLKEKFWKKFEDLQKTHLKLEAPEVNKETKFIVTAYYSPVPWQIKYSTWSYEAEMKLNGWWNTASWKKPYPWTIAAPRNYAFWTKISLEWFWVWVVEDRGWAIVNSWDKWFSYDRLDIWMWYGDEARERTRLWWVRTVSWKILDNSASVKVFYEDNNFSEKILKVENNSKIEEKVELTFENIFINPENPDLENVKKAQELFKKVKLYDSEIDWDYSKIKEILVNFQVENNVIESRNSPEAWYFWKKTFEALKNKFWQNFDKNISEKIVEKTEKSEVNEGISEQKSEKNLENQKNDDSLNLKEKERISKVRDNFYQKILLKNAWNEEKVKEEISELKATMNKVLENYSWRRRDILAYFVEIL